LLKESAKEEQLQKDEEQIKQLKKILKRKQKK